MENVFVGKIVNTHGIKGELRIKSDFEYKNRVFKVSNKLIIKGQEYTIKSYRVHKEFDMVTFDGYDNINDVLHLKGINVFISREYLNLDDGDYILSDLIDLELVLNDTVVGKITDYTTGLNPLLCVSGVKDFYIPLKGNFIELIDVKSGKVVVNDNVKELML